MRTTGEEDGNLGGLQMSAFERRVGRFLLNKGIVDRAQLQAAIDHAIEGRMAFCDALEDLKLVDASILSEVRSRGGLAPRGEASSDGGKPSGEGSEAPAPGAGAAAPKRKRLGDYLLDKGLIDDRQLKQALDHARANDMLLGQALVSLSFITEKALADQILEQRNDLRKLAARGQRLRIGDILVAQKAITPEQLKEGLEHSFSKGVRLGEALQALGHVKEVDIAKALSEQLMIPMVNLAKSPPDPNVLIKVPKKMVLKHQAVPYRLEQDILTVAMVDPLDILAMDDLSTLTGATVVPVLITPMDFERAVAAYIGLDDDLENSLEILMDDPHSIQSSGGEGSAPIIQLVNKVLALAASRGASDVHIDPTEENLRIRFRVDGMLRIFMEPPLEVAPAVASRLKVIADLDIAETRLPQDGKFRLRIDNRLVDFRLATIPVSYGEKITIRLLDQSCAKQTLDEIGMEPYSLKAFREGVHSPNGIVLVTGPTGSGKTTSLYAALMELMDPKINISTVEDPVEYSLPGINQVQVSTDFGRTFGTTLRAFLRQDPDVILVGEIRDQETASISLKAAMTGHLVLSTLHTNDAISSIERLTSMGCDRFLISTALRTVMAQRLIRRLCKQCRQLIPPDEAALRTMGVNAALIRQSGVEAKSLAELRLYRPEGCPACNEGYSGRTGVYETLFVDTRLREMIVEGASNFELQEYALSQGMILQRHSAVVKYLQGVTSAQEVDRVTVAKLSKERRGAYTLKDEVEDAPEGGAASATVMKEIRQLSELMTSLGSMAGGPSREKVAPATGALLGISKSVLQEVARAGKLEGKGRQDLHRLALGLEQLQTYLAPAPPRMAQVDLDQACRTQIVQQMAGLAMRASLLSGRPCGVEGVQVSEELSAGMVLCDWPGVKTCLEQILVNALQALGGTGKIKIGARRCVEGARQLFELSVLDSGGGLAPERVEWVKAPFHSLRTDGLGLGLGLAMIEERVQAMGGSFELVSKAGKGCLARIRVPLA